MTQTKRRFQKFGPRVLGDDADRKQLIDAIEYMCDLAVPESEKIGAWIQMFDDSGKQDERLKKAENKICVIREWQKI